MRIFALLFTFAFLASACGNGNGDEMDEPADEPAADEPQETGQVEMPDWFELDEEGESVTLNLTAGETPDNNHWNYNGLTAGDAIIRVPVDHELTVNLTNDDPNMGHSAGIGELQDSYPSSFTEEEAQPVFEGAVTPNATNLAQATQPGEEDSFTATVDETGEYALICYVQGHAAQNMWVEFHVTEDMDEVGVEM